MLTRLQFVLKKLSNVQPSNKNHPSFVLSRTKPVKFRNASQKFFCQQTAQNTPKSILKSIKSIPKYHLIELFIIGAGISWYFWDNEDKDYIPYNRFLASKCIHNISKGNETTIFWSMCTLAAMSNTSDKTIIQQLIDNGIVDTLNLVMEIYLNDQEDRKLSLETIEKVFVCFARISNFDCFSMLLSSPESTKLIENMIKISLKHKEFNYTWKNHFGRIILNLIQNGDLQYKTHLFNLQNCCLALSSSIIPFSTNLKFLKSLVFELEGLLDISDDEEMKAKKFSIFDPEFVSNQDQWSKPTILYNFIDIMLSLHKNSTFQQLKSEFSIENSFLTSVANLSSLLSYRDSMISTKIQNDIFEYEEIQRLHEDSENSNFFSRDHQKLQAHLASQLAPLQSEKSEIATLSIQLVQTLPQSASDSKSIRELLRTLASLTSTLNESVLLQVINNQYWLNSMLQHWLLTEPRHSVSTREVQTSIDALQSLDLAKADSTISQVEDYQKQEEVEACEIPRPSKQPIDHYHPDIRRFTLMTLANLSTLPIVAQQISLSRCLCSVQIPTDLSTLAEMPSSTLNEPMQFTSTDPTLLIILSNIFFNVARMAPHHVRGSDIERLISIHYDDFALLNLLASISFEPLVSQAMLNNFIVWNFITSHFTNQIPGPHKRDVKRNTAHILSNMAVADPQLFASKIETSSSSQMRQILHDALESEDKLVRSDVIRLFASLSTTSTLLDSKFTAGITVLYQNTANTKKSNEQSQNETSKKNSEQSLVFDTENFDIVFIHGINGHSITTWRVEPTSIVPNETKSNSNDESKGEEVICWPRDWIPEHFPNARVLTVAYDIALTKWSKNETAPLRQQSMSILHKLRLAGVGSKPVIFIAHSFGGLITKELLHIASTHDDYKDVLRNTRAAMFFSTPHHGTIVAGYAKGATDLFFRGSAAVMDLHPTNWYLEHLNDSFPKFAPFVNTLSIGEGETCFMGANLGPFGSTEYACYQIVPDASSDPGWKSSPVSSNCEEFQKHEFVKFPYNHRQVCKPSGREDPRWKLVLQFLTRNAPMKAPFEKSKQAL